MDFDIIVLDYVIVWLIYSAITFTVNGNVCLNVYERFAKLLNLCRIKLKLRK